MGEPVSKQQNSSALRIIGWIALILVIIGALNWGMIGFFNTDVINLIFGHAISRVIYAIVGLAGIWSFSFFKCLKHVCCSKDKCDTRNNKDQR